MSCLYSLKAPCCWIPSAWPCSNGGCPPPSPQDLMVDLNRILSTDLIDTSQPCVTTSQPSITTSQPCVTTSQPSITNSQPCVTTSQSSPPEFQLHLPGPNWALPIDLNLVSDQTVVKFGCGSVASLPPAAGHKPQPNDELTRLLDCSARGPRPEGSPELIINSPGIKVRGLAWMVANK